MTRRFAALRKHQRGVLLNPYRFGTTAFDPLSISGCILWLDGDDLTTITSSGGAISAWADKSASALTFSQATADRKPLTDTTRFGGKNCVDFDHQIGVDNRWLQSASMLSIPVTSTAFMVVHWTDSVINYLALALQKGSATNSISAGTGVPYWMVYGIPDSPSGYARTAALQSQLDASTYHYSGTTIPGDRILPGTKGLVTFVSDTNMASSSLRLDRAACTRSSAGTNIPSGMQVDTIGSTDSTYDSNGAIAELIVYDTALSSTDIDTVEAYLRTKWGTP